MARPLRFDGWIVDAAFASGDRFVVGRWPRSPLGRFADVMGRRADGPRVRGRGAPGGFGFSESPPMPSAVRVTSLIEA